MRAVFPGCIPLPTPQKSQRFGGRVYPSPISGLPGEAYVPRAQTVLSACGNNGSDDYGTEADGFPLLCKTAIWPSPKEQPSLLILSCPVIVPFLRNWAISPMMIEKFSSISSRYFFSSLSRFGIYKLRINAVPIPTAIRQISFHMILTPILPDPYKWRIMTELVTIPGDTFNQTVTGINAKSISPIAMGLYPSNSKNTKENTIASKQAAKRCHALRKDLFLWLGCREWSIYLPKQNSPVATIGQSKWRSVCPMPSWWFCSRFSRISPPLFS